MRNKRINGVLDIYFTIIITFFLLLTLSFSYLQLGNTIENYVMLTVLAIVALISYYLDRTAALIISLVIDFIYASVKFYFSISAERAVNFEMLYWIILIPVSNVIIALIAERISKIQYRIDEILKDREEVAMVDKETGFRNLKAYMNEMPIYCNLHKRYNLPVTLILVRIKYGDKLKRIVGYDYYREILVKCFDEIRGSLRYEDRKYLIDEETFAYVLISEKEGVDIVKERLKIEINKMKVGKEKYYRDLDIQVAIGGYTLIDESLDSMEILVLAEKELDYDV